MAKRKYSSEEVIQKLREADVLLGQGKTILEAFKQLGVTDKTYFRWRKVQLLYRLTQAPTSRRSLPCIRTLTSRLSMLTGSGSSVRTCKICKWRVMPASFAFS